MNSDEKKYWTGKKKGEKVKSKRIWHEKEIRFRDMDRVSLSKESCTFVKKENTFDYRASYNLSKARRDKVDFEKERPTI
ncbi:hypothetical protein Leryth_024574 [Lithospermum erythrorhizon]|nr:hypothetical protein Leryth_024574 [Lithospermum erythrorhizon]